MTTSTAYRGRHWAVEVKEPPFLWLILTTAIPGYIYDLQKNHNNFRVKFGYIPLAVLFIAIIVLIGVNVSWPDLATLLVLKRLNVS